MKVLLDHRSGNLNSDTQFDIHDKDGLVDILHKLNGTSHTMLSIERDDNHRLDVGGGSDLFVVICTTASEKNLTLLNPKDLNSEDLVELCAGGQYAEFPKRIVVDKEVVTKAVIYFMEENEHRLDWEEG